VSFKDQLFFQMPYLAEQRVESAIHDYVRCVPN
jgi:hypothetical protein